MVTGGLEAGITSPGPGTAFWYTAPAPPGYGDLTPVPGSLPGQTPVNVPILDPFPDPVQSYLKKKLTNEVLKFNQSKYNH